MRASMLVLIAVLGLAARDGIGRLHAEHLRRVAYEDAIERYQGGQAVQRASAPRRPQPQADGGANPADAGRMT